MGVLVISHRQVPDPPLALPSATGLDGVVTITSELPPPSSILVDPNAQPGQDPTSPPPLVPTQTFTTITPETPTPIPTTSSADPSDASTTLEASSTSSRPIALSTVIGSCVGAFIGAVALICLALWFYRRYQRSLKSHYHSKSRAPHNTRADFQRRLSHRENWGKLEDSNPEDKWEGQTKRANTEESVGPMEKLTMFKKTPSTRTAYTHTTEEPSEATHYEVPHPFANPYSSYNPNQGEYDDNGDRANAPMPSPKPFTDSDAKPVTFSWNDAAQGSFLSVRTQSERLSGAMSPTLNMAIPTPPATASPFHHWESAEIIDYEGQSAEVVSPFGGEDNNRPAESRKNLDNPFFGAYEHVPQRQSRAAATDSMYVPALKVDKGKGRAVDPFHDDHGYLPAPSTAVTPSLTVITSPPLETSAPSGTTPTSATALPPPRPAFATHVPTVSNSSVASTEYALASLIAALDGATTEDEIQERLRIASMQPSVKSVVSVYSEVEEDMTRAFPLPPSSPGDATPTLDSYLTADLNRTSRQ